MSVALMLQTTHLGDLEWDSASEISLPLGLPGFENERRMVPVEVPAQRPLVYLQSVVNPEICFVALPVRTIDPAFELVLSDEDRSALSLSEGVPEIGGDVLCLALLIPDAGSVRVNLDAPIVINLHNSRCVQALSGGESAGCYRLSREGSWERTCS